MKLIAKKPCSFGGKKFFIGDEIAEELVSDPAAQEKYGIIAIVGGGEGTGVSGGQPGTLFTQEQVAGMIAKAVEDATAELQENLSKTYEAELSETAPGAYKDTVMITVGGGEGTENIAVLATEEEIRQVFAIMQMSAADGAKEIESVKSENVLILLHAADSRKGVKNAAKERADKLFSSESILNESAGGNEPTDTNTEGADT
ncbi:MAG: hypothetical protein NC409_12465 [Clostridium sp.]|nr:hypothetical protein [Clostridium sp.]